MNFYFILLSFLSQNSHSNALSINVLELRLAQLALDPNNSPAWDVPEQERRPSTKMPLFVKAQSVYKSQHQTEVSTILKVLKYYLIHLQSKEMNILSNIYIEVHRTLETALTMRTGKSIAVCI